ncbi:Regulator of nonsense transcripts 1-like protein [Apiospora marii]|uniref:Regulator of nonsense transcripts 1-like protein n=1 Tax=Apiospora marii TaxID=335849 RepID=UPI0031306D6F
MGLWEEFEEGDYRSVFQSFNMRSWGKDDDFVFPLRQVIPQKESYFDPGKRPAKNSFHSVDEYCATIGLGAKVVQTLSEQEEGFEFASDLRILKQEDGGLLAIVEIPEKTRKEILKCRSDPLSPGARGFVYLQYSTNGATAQSEPTDFGVRLLMEFIEPFPSSPPGFLAVKLKARQKRPRRSPYDQSLGRDEKKPDLETEPNLIGISPDWLKNSLEDTNSMSFVLKTIPHVAVPYNLSGGESMEYILRQSGTPGYVDTVIRHSEFCYVFEAWQYIYTKLEQERLKFLSNPTPHAERIDIYAGLADKQIIESDHLQLNPSQKKALDLGRSAPAGYVIANGGPGTGKTHFIIQAVKPFFLDAKPHRLLLTSAGNRGVDSIAQQLNDWLNCLDPVVRGDSYIVRLHSIKTEANIFLREAEVAKRKVFAAKARKAAEDSQQPPNTTMQNRSIVDHYETYGGGKLNEIGDERVQNLSLAVCTKMKANLSKNSGLQQDYDDYAAGKITEPDALKAFHRKVREYLIHTLRHATAVCATVSGVGDDAVRASFGVGDYAVKMGYPKCDLVVVDEAARVSEYQWWPLIAFYDDGRKPIGKIMVGDIKQMGPSSRQDAEGSPLVAQMELSLQERFHNRGIPYESFDIQYRADPEIATIYNNVCYDGKLTSDERTRVDARPLAQALVKYNEIAYGKKHSVVFLDVAGAKERKEYIKINQNVHQGRPVAPHERSRKAPTVKEIPKFCDQYIFTISRLLEGLISAGFVGGRHAASVAVLTTYKLEYKRLRHMKTKLANAYPHAANIVIETVDKVQGREYDIVIVDPATVDNATRFLTFKRLNVMFSRARCGLYVVGCAREWEILSRNPLGSFARELPLLQGAVPDRQWRRLP